MYPTDLTIRAELRHAAQLVGIGALKLGPGDPVVRFVNRREGNTIITRDAHLYRANVEWEERLFDRTSPVPRMPR